MEDKPITDAELCAIRVPTGTASSTSTSRSARSCPGWSTRGWRCGSPRRPSAATPDSPTGTSASHASSSTRCTPSRRHASSRTAPTERQGSRQLAGQGLEPARGEEQWLGFDAYQTWIVRRDPDDGRFRYHVHRRRAAPDAGVGRAVGDDRIRGQISTRKPGEEAMMLSSRTSRSRSGTSTRS